MQTDIENNNEVFDIVDDTKIANLAKAKNQSSKIGNILEKLSNENLENIENLIKDIKEFYDTNKRHRYSDITSHLYNLHIKQDGKIDNIRKNIKFLIDTIDNTEQLKDNLLKLQDHILLEIVRLNHIKEIKQEIEKTSKEVQESKKSYITILGIFASIILAFVSGISFSNSVLSNIDKASIYRLIFVMAFIALFVGNILYALFAFLSKIALAGKEYKNPLIWFNIIICGIIFCDICAYIIDKNLNYLFFICVNNYSN